MSHHLYFILFAFVISANASIAQKKWDGGAGNNLWNNALNWTGNRLPVATDNIILDNSYVSGNYGVVLPSLPVTVRSITISPATGKTIDLVLPPQNIYRPGLTVTGPGYGMVIGSGGIFRNSSGAKSGNSVVIADSVRINNNGKYIHNTVSGHASNAQLLSATAGTEKGIFELNIPAASSTISLSGRTFGRLMLTADAAGGACNYTASGSNPVLIREDLRLDAGVTLTLNFSDTIFIKGNLEQQPGTFNLGSSIKSMALQVEGNINQLTGGVITESGFGRHSIVLANPQTQLLSLKGSVTNDVALVKNGPGVTLLKSALSLPYKLSLKEGPIVTSDQWLLTLKPTCAIEADTLSDASLIEGPLKKEGLSNSGFLFPVGRSMKMRWLRLERATGTFVVEYFKDDPRQFSGTMGAGLHHVSAVEYWNVTSTGGSSAVVKLSFVHPHSGGVTNLSHLRVGRLVSGTWLDAGNAGYSGSAGSNGWVSSVTAGGFSANSQTFALASAMGRENPLPLYPIAFTAVRSGQQLLFRWKVDSREVVPEVFELQESGDGRNFITCATVPALKGQDSYSLPYRAGYINSFYRVRVKTSTGIAWHESRPVKIEKESSRRFAIEGSNVVSDALLLSAVTLEDARLRLTVFDAQGSLRKVMTVALKRGSSLVSVPVDELSPGIYGIREVSGTFNQPALRFIKR